MPLLDRLKDKVAGNPKFLNEKDFTLALECLAFCLTHMQEHGYIPNYVWLDDEQYIEYCSLYPEGTKTPTFFGLAVRSAKSG